MAKSKQPKIKLSQPIALEPRLRDVLEKHGVRKGPTVDKVEALQKAATAKKWLFTIHEDRKDGLAHATLEVPGPDGLLYFKAEAMTIPLAMTLALCDALENGPQQSSFMDNATPADPDGKDLPMFRGNGGVAGPIGVAIDPQQVADELTADIETAIRDGAIEGVSLLADGTVGDAPAAPASGYPGDGWQFQFIVPPADTKRWKASIPTDLDDQPVVRFEEGGETSALDRGWYLNPAYSYDHKAGEIRIKSTMAGQHGAIAWSRHERERTAVDAVAAPGAAMLDTEPSDVEATLRASGIPVRFDSSSGLYRNANGDAYPERWAEQEAGSIQRRSIGFVTGS